jgi:hypothetical protein
MGSELIFNAIVEQEKLALTPFLISSDPIFPLADFRKGSATKIRIFCPCL